MQKRFAAFCTIALIIGVPQGVFANYEDPEETFSVEFPEFIKVKQTNRVITLFGRSIPTRLHEASSPSLYLAVMAMDVELSRDPGNRTADQVAVDMLHGAFSAGAVTIEKREGPYTRAGCAVRGAFGSKSRLSVHYQVHVCNHHAFQLSAISDRRVEGNPTAQRFFETFRARRAPVSKMSTPALNIKRVSAEPVGKGEAPKLRNTSLKAAIGHSPRGWVAYSDTHGRYECLHPPDWRAQYDDSGRYWRTLFASPEGEILAVKVRKTAIPDAGSDEVRKIEEALLTRPIDNPNIRAAGLLDELHYDRKATFAGRKARAYSISGKIDGVPRRQYYLQFLCERRPFMVNLISDDTNDPDEIERIDRLFSSFVAALEVPSCGANQPQDSSVGSLSDGPYVDPKGFFSIEPPRGWRLQTFPHDERGRARWHAPGSDTTLSILVKPTEFEVRDIGELIEKLKENDRRLGIRARVERITLPSGEAVQRSFRVEGIEALFVSLLARDGMAHDLMFMAPPKEFADFRDQAMASIESYQRLVRVVDEDERLRQLVTSRRRRAELFLERGDRAAALEMIEKGLELDPHDRDLLGLKKRVGNR